MGVSKGRKPIRFDMSETANIIGKYNDLEEQKIYDRIPDGWQLLHPHHMRLRVQPFAGVNIPFAENIESERF